MRVSPWALALLGALVVAMLAVDLGFDRSRFKGSRHDAAETETTGTARAPSLHAAAMWSGAWVGLGLAFGLVVLALAGPAPALTYVTAYLLGKSLSLDNLFVFVLIFRELAIPAEYQGRVLHWGILGALAMQALLIAGGVYLLELFDWLVYPFGALILLAAVRLLWGEERERQMVGAMCAVCESRLARFIPVTPVARGGSFLIRQHGRLVATPLLIALVVAEASGLIFALDAIPAALAVTREPFLVYTSNAFALLGPRSLFFLLAGAVARFHALRYTLAAMLAFVSARLLLGGIVHVPDWVSLAVIVGALGMGVAASMRDSMPLPAGAVRPGGRHAT